jgi:6-phosphogluconolactonase (cycloisomerase 2 family)
VAPGAVISGTATSLKQPEYLFLDEAADRLYVANFGDSSVLVFDGISTATGNVTPTRKIAGATTNLAQPLQVFVDTNRNLLYVADQLEVYVFDNASTVNGDVAPLHTISLGFVAAGIFLESVGDRLYVSDATANAIKVFDSASTLTGAATPARTITGALTLLNQPAGLFLDAAENLIVSNAGNGTITLYPLAATADGNVPPSATIAGANTTLATAAQLTVNAAAITPELFVADPVGGHVAVFANYTTGGNIAPVRDISGSGTTLTPPAATATTARGIALDTTR